MTLATLQEQLQAHVLASERAIECQIVGAGSDDVAARLAIYSDAYRLRLTEALASNYPALAKLLGVADFATLAGAYIVSHVPHKPSIRYYGDVLGEFLSTNAAYREVPLLAELAAWEWAMTEVFDAADAATVTAETLARLSPEEWAQLRFTIHPSVRQIDLRWNIPPLWTALTSDQPRPAPELNAVSQAWLQWRESLQVRFRSLDVAEAAALRWIAGQQSFGDMCERLCDIIDEAEAPTRAATYLRGWVCAGLIVGTRLD
jgi:hypothetical protein